MRTSVPGATRQICAPGTEACVPESGTRYSRAGVRHMLSVVKCAGVRHARFRDVSAGVLVPPTRPCRSVMHSAHSAGRIVGSIACWEIRVVCIECGWRQTCGGVMEAVIGGRWGL